MPQGDKMNRSTLQQSNMLNESKTRQKNGSCGIQYGSAKLDYRLSQNLPNILWCYKAYRENHRKLESEIDSRRKKFSWGENIEMYITGRCTITITITLTHRLRKCIDGYQLTKLQEKINHQTYMDNIKPFAENEKRIGNPYTGMKIYSQDLGINFGFEKLAMLIIKIRKQHMME